MREINKINKYVSIRSKLDIMFNIMEAVITDFFANFQNNAICGFLLFINPLQHVTVENNNNVLKHYFQDRWTSLYETWNLAFITGNINNLDIYYSKLLIPSLLNANSSEYITLRGYALFLALDMSLTAHKRNKNFIMPNNKEIAKLWGEINVNYGIDLLKNQFKKMIKPR